MRREPALTPVRLRNEESGGRIVPGRLYPRLNAQHGAVFFFSKDVDEAIHPLADVADALAVVLQQDLAALLPVNRIADRRGGSINAQNARPSTPIAVVFAAPEGNACCAAAANCWNGPTRCSTRPAGCGARISAGMTIS